MKTILSLSLAFAVAWSSSAAEVRIGTVDLQKVMSDFYKWQQASNYLKEKEVSYFKELEGMRLEGSRLKRETEDLQERAVNEALSATERAQTRKNFQLKLTDLQEFEMRYDSLRSQ